MSDWFYTRGGQQSGPVTFDQLKELARAGQLDKSDLTWTSIMKDWTPSGQVEGIFASPSSISPPMPPSDSETRPIASLDTQASHFEKLQDSQEKISKQQKMVRPKSMTVTSVLNFVFGGISVLGSLYAIMLSNSLMANSLVGLSENAMQQMMVLLLSGLVGLCVGGVAIVAGVGLIRVASWARGWTLAYAIVGIVNALLGLVVGLLQARGKIGPESTGAIIGAVIGTIAGCIYPLILIRLLRCAKWKEAFADSNNSSG